MNLVALLRIILLIIGAVLAYHLIFKQQLPSKSLGSIVTYFVGIIIVFLAVGWLISLFLPQFATNLLDVGRTSTEWQEFIDNSESIVDDAFNSETTGGDAAPTTAPTTIQIVVTATPNGNTEADPGSGQNVYVVVQGDTLYNIAERFGTTVDELMRKNGLASHIIQPGDRLTLP
jgi:hypothetical protein